MVKQIAPSTNAASAWLVVVLAAVMSSACGGGGTSASEQATANAASMSYGDVATGITTLMVEEAALASQAASPTAQPAFHAAPIELVEPDDTDAVDPSASARREPRRQAVPRAGEHLGTRRVTAQMLDSLGHRAHAHDVAAPQGTASFTRIYSPAQIRAAYGFSALRPANAMLTAEQAAQLGAGQTIYIVNAMHDPAIAEELAAFNRKFGLPACTSKTIAPNASLPLAAPAERSCEFSVVYATASGTMTSRAPAYDASWATEIAIDVQWAHATAPLARIVLIEAPDATLNSLQAAVRLANAMGPGVVSMSFSANEGSFNTTMDSSFTAPSMTYVAATGDAGAGVTWPAVSAHVLAVGGTTLRYEGAGDRSETAWSGSGGGTSQYTPRPGYQAITVPGLGAVHRRTVADVAFNADPATGQYIAVQKPDSSSITWMSGAGTSIATPQWAGLLAIANAGRALASKPMLGAPHALLYGPIASVPGTYADDFIDIINGSNGDCADCSARPGHDPVSGLGSPHASRLLASLIASNVTVPAPIVTPAAIAGQVGKPLTFTVSATGANDIGYTLQGAPAGMTIDSSGVVAWASPSAGTYQVTAIATDVRTGASGQALHTVTVSASSGPTVHGGMIGADAASALSFNVSVTAANPVIYKLIDAPTGVSLDNAGNVHWAQPISGQHAIVVGAQDAVSGLQGQGTYAIRIGTPGPAISDVSIQGTAGQPVSGSFSVSAPGATTLAMSISDAPIGMSFHVSGLTFTAYWPRATAGSYMLKLSVIDSAGMVATKLVPITIVH